jgi:hypothetical protein
LYQVADGILSPLRHDVTSVDEHTVGEGDYYRAGACARIIDEVSAATSFKDDWQIRTPRRLAETVHRSLERRTGSANASHSGAISSYHENVGETIVRRRA